MHWAFKIAVSILLFAPSVTLASDDLISWDEYKLKDKKLNGIIEPFYRNIGIVQYDDKMKKKTYYLSDIALSGVGSIYLDGRPKRSEADKLVRNHLACKLGREAVLTAVEVTKNTYMVEAALRQSYVNSNSISNSTLAQLHTELYPELPTPKMDNTSTSSVLESVISQHLLWVAKLREYHRALEKSAPGAKEFLGYVETAEKFVNSQYYCVTRATYTDYTKTYDGKIPW